MTPLVRGYFLSMAAPAVALSPWIFDRLVQLVRAVRGLRNAGERASLRTALRSRLAGAPLDHAALDQVLAAQAIGSPETVERRLAELIAETGADELMATTPVTDAEARHDSVRRLAAICASD